ALRTGSIKNIAKNRRPYKALETQAVEPPTLTPDQNKALELIRKASGTALLHGVTGSGKTEVYMHAISEALQNGKTAVMLVPEISLTPQIFSHFRNRFGDKVAILHSGLSAGERNDEWHRLRSGEAKIAIGARSAIFAPVQNIGIIIIDEEHDGSYISSSNPRYDTIGVAEFRAKHNNCPLILGSATPSIESYYKATQVNNALIELPERVNKKPMPHIDIVDLRQEVIGGNSGALSGLLKQKLAECIEGGNQAILFLNRRGFSAYLMCRACGYVAKCTDCDVALVYHREDNVLKCHYCNHRFSPPQICPECKSPHIKHGAAGTQRLADELESLFPDAGVLRMDNDTTQTKDAHVKILQAFGKGEAQILVGTQMVAKGHDFANVTLVGIIDADLSLYVSDYRSTERTFQLITQAAGRAGRDQKQGSVVLQTHTPQHYVYKLAVTNNYKDFFAKECNLRQITKYPPFSTIVRVLVSGEDETKVATATKEIWEGVKTMHTVNTDTFAYLGVMKSPVGRIQNKFRYQVLMRLVGDITDDIITKVYQLVNTHSGGKANIFVELNPANLS
ncbi:MAG: primosomal protein N', partial [Firmicutes bacterium]|nr:primosomal protein N' [Bacillota bacterium]